MVPQESNFWGWLDSRCIMMTATHLMYTVHMLVCAENFIWSLFLHPTTKPGIILILTLGERAYISSLKLKVSFCFILLWVHSKGWKSQWAFFACPAQTSESRRKFRYLCAEMWMSSLCMEPMQTLTMFEFSLIFQIGCKGYMGLLLGWPSAQRGELCSGDMARSQFSSQDRAKVLYSSDAGLSSA